MITVAALFEIVELSPSGPIRWGEPVGERGSGVYVVVQEPADEIIYIGRATSIGKRIKQFYSHEYGAKAPHRGGQEILLLTKPRSIYWAPTINFQFVESQMIATFREREGKLPYGNKKKGDRLLTDKPN